MSRDLQLNHTSFSLLISCNKNISAQIKKFKDLFLKTMGVRKIFPTLLPALKQVYSVRLFVCMVSFIITIFPSEAFEVCALIYLVTWQSPLAELAGRDTQGCVLQGACSPRVGPAWGHWDLPAPVTLHACNLVGKNLVTISVRHVDTRHWPLRK